MNYRVLAFRFRFFIAGRISFQNKSGGDIPATSRKLRLGQLNKNITWSRKELE